MTSQAPPALTAGLGGLFDLAGVHGSFIVSGGGAIAARALSDMIDDATLEEVGARILRLGETLGAVGLEPELCVLRFAEHKLYVKTMPGGALAIVTSGDVSVPALRMAANLVARKVAPELVRFGATVPERGATGAVAVAAAAAPPPFARAGRASSPSLPIAAAKTPPPSLQPSSAAGPRMYRGRPID